MLDQAKSLGASPEAAEAPLSMRLDGILCQARDALGVAQTLHGRHFGFPPVAGEATGAKLQVARVDSIETTIGDLRQTVFALHQSLLELNNRI